MGQLKVWGEIIQLGTPRSEISNMVVLQPVAISADGTVVFLNQWGVREMSLPTQTRQLVDSDNTVLVENGTAAPVVLLPPAVPSFAQRIEIVDALGNAGTYPISITATVNGVGNPILVDVAFASAVLLFYGGLIYRLR